MAQKITLKVRSWTVGWEPIVNSVLDRWSLDSVLDLWIFRALSAILLEMACNIGHMRLELKRKIWVGLQMKKLLSYI